MKLRNSFRREKGTWSNIYLEEPLGKRVVGKNQTVCINYIDVTKRSVICHNLCSMTKNINDKDRRETDQEFEIKNGSWQRYV